MSDAACLRSVSELCNDIDDDCDNKVDEDFRVGGDGAYISNAHCGSCNAACAGTIPGALAEHCAISEDGTPHCEVTRCANGYLANLTSCRPRSSDLCATCSPDVGCPTPGDLCLQVDGSFVCGYDCSADNAHGTAAGQCPQGLRCTDQGGGVMQCIPQAETCGCDPQGVEASRGCTNSNAAGHCAGRQYCDTNGRWTSCDAKVPEAEYCNGEDDDCDGEIDEDNPQGGGACDAAALGVCAIGTQSCQHGELICEQTTTAAQSDACYDGVDDDCNGVADDDCCAHDPCLSGDPLESSCDACVDEVCAVDDFCCTVAWDSACVERLAIGCGAARCGVCSDPLGDEECSAGKRCEPTVSGTGLCTGPVGNGTEHAACLRPSDCASGYFCIEAAGDLGECLRVCDLDLPWEDCPDSLECVPLEVPVYAGGSTFAVCD